MASDKSKRFKSAQIVNRKAEHEYKFVKKYTAGMMLSGTEVKALREGMANMNDAFCYMQKGEMFVKNMFISEYSNGNIYNHDARRLRKLLLKGQELKVLERKLTEKGLTVVPYRIFFSERGFAKLEVCLAEGKKLYDKRESIKERENKREMDRIKKII